MFKEIVLLTSRYWSDFRWNYGVLTALVLISTLPISLSNTAVFVGFLIASPLGLYAQFRAFMPAQRNELTTLTCIGLGTIVPGLLLALPAHILTRAFSSTW